MSVYIVTGFLGAGKTLASVGRMMEYVNRGRRIATNLDIYPEHFKHSDYRDLHLVRIPDKPGREHLDAIGLGYDGDYQGEKFNGLLVLDECGTWFNSRAWADKGRQAVNAWFMHARKLRWDVLLIIQNIDMLDKQAKDVLAEHVVWCRRLDKFRIPFLGTFTKFLGFEVRPPQIHMGIVKYGKSMNSITVDRWWYRGRDLFALYDTEQSFYETEGGNYSLLTPWHLVGRYEKSGPTWLQRLNPIVMPAIRVVLIVCLPLINLIEWLCPAPVVYPVFRFVRPRKLLEE